MILDDILEYKKHEVEVLRRRPGAAIPPSGLMIERRDFTAALRSTGEVRLIAEIKRQSPSKGPIRPDLDPARFALDYERAGAAAISVLADEHFFGGSITDLFEARDVVDVPVLRKDFIIDEAQIYETAGIDGPDAILLIVAALTDDRLEDLLRAAKRMGQACLVETHSELEVETALEAGAEIIGINNRDLQTFTVDLGTTERLCELIPEGKIVVSESGIHTRDDIERLQAVGVNAFLVGETILQSPNPEATIRELTGYGG